MTAYSIEESDQFLKDLERAVVWILITNMEQSEAFAEKKVDDFVSELSSLKDRLKLYPESGATEDIEGVRKFSIYDGRYSVKWIVDHVFKIVILVTLIDLKYPKEITEFVFEE